MDSIIEVNKDGKNNNNNNVNIPREIILDIIQDIVKSLQYNRNNHLLPSEHINEQDIKDQQQKQLEQQLQQLQEKQQRQQQEENDLVDESSSNNNQQQNQKDDDQYMNINSPKKFKLDSDTINQSIFNNLQLQKDKLDLLNNDNINDQSQQQQPVQNNTNNNNNRNDRIIHFTQEKMIINQETKLENTVTIWQPRVLKQVKNDSCGYYSLFNGISFYNACRAEDMDHSIEYLNRMLCRPLFWHIYTISMNLLIDKARMKKKAYYPWNEKYIQKGVMERCYIDYLLTSDNVLSKQQYPITVLPDWAIDSLRNNRLGLQEIKELQEISHRFKTRDSYAHIFMVGVAVHWISIVISKHVTGDVEIVLMDSRNHNLLGGTDTEFQAIVDKHPEVPERLRKGYFLSLHDPKPIVHILRDCIIGSKDIGKTLVDINLTGFLENYYTYVNPLESLSLHESINIKDITLVQLIHWLEDYWPPSVIEHNICQVLDSIIQNNEDMIKYFDVTLIESFSKWTKEVSSHSLEMSEIVLLKRFSVTVQWFTGKFALKSD
ncbi:hypothetical protein DFA_00227 [Cavenderia fasciculata]|uniref:Uncharacterized protein n=1 Tax=Cavenderia fasciculata TaxID=261658 RepID=F4PXY9_CACFS|nr:uncharacterized protein DFA_00227 [Cavenderia fasciculata]EGG19649.1 hypothetical protein DFA_00227 [Cavenderia fasciculata]|eukprot:XP_004357943.1 hypothetical protein DFA_00227 [Cavenderia fasciculata]